MTTNVENPWEGEPDIRSAIPALERLSDLVAENENTRVSGLHYVSRDLKKLDDLLARGRAQKLAGLNSLAADGRLRRLEELNERSRTEFDAIDFIGRMRFGSGRALWASEEFHSNVLAWLLNPQESHGLGDSFLHTFLISAGISPVEESSHWSSTEVIREWSNEVDGRYGFLDLLIVDVPAQFLCVIENKVFSSEHNEQLTRYRKALERDYPDFARRFVFLTPEGTKPYREEEQEYWTSIPYSAVFDILQNLIETNQGTISEEVRSFLCQYSTTLRREIMPETSLSQLARNIYLEHWEAIDLIVDNKPNWVAESKQWLKEAVARQNEWALDLEGRAYVRFRSRDWDQFEAMQRGIGWASSGSNALLLFQFRYEFELPYLDLGLSTGNEANNPIRQKLFEAVKQHPALFKPRETSFTDGWMLLHQEPDNILHDADCGVGWDDGTTRAKLDTWVANFAANQFPAMNEVIVNCFREFEAEQQR